MRQRQPKPFPRVETPRTREHEQLLLDPRHRQELQEVEVVQQPLVRERTQEPPLEPEQPPRERRPVVPERHLVEWVREFLLVLRDRRTQVLRPEKVVPVVQPP